MGSPRRFWADLWQVVRVLPVVERDRRRTSAHKAVAEARHRGLVHAARSDEERLRLRRVISAVDGLFPSGPNCLRRSLLEMSVDRDAARERLFAGLKSGGSVGSGHAWLESQGTSERYDAVLTI